MADSLDQKRKSNTFQGFPWLKMSGSRSSKKKKLQPAGYAYSSGSDSPGDSPNIPHRRHSYHPDSGEVGAVALVDAETDGLFTFKSSRQPFGLHNPKSAQHLLSLLQQPGVEKLLGPNEEGDNPLHSLVRQTRPEKDKIDILVTFLTHSSVNINSQGRGGMTALHYAVQSNDLTTIRVLLAFGADVNLVNSRNHTPLDVATFSWLAHERQAKINSGTNNLAAVNEHKYQYVNVNVFPDLSASPMPSPVLRRTQRKLLTRMGSTSSWVYVDDASSSCSSALVSENGVENSEEQSLKSSEDSREFTRSVMPIKSADLADEFPGETASRGQAVLESVAAVLNILYSVHALSGRSVKRKFNKIAVISSFSESEEFQKKIESEKNLNPFWSKSDLEKSVKIKDFLEGRTVFSLYEELDYNINLRLESQSSLTHNTDEAIALAIQQREMVHFKKTAKNGIGFEVGGGSRLLFLDGGGIKGLVQLEVMRQIEETTGRKITELFDWIIGTSIGGILTLGLVYAKKSVRELQQMCFKIKEDIFTKPRAGLAFDTKAMEKMIMEEFDSEMTMNDIKRPKVLVAAVSKKTVPPQLHFFNNCFDDDFSRTKVWKVARYTSATPILFTEFEGYVDGGVLANNPCDYGLTAIQNFHRELHMNLPISMVVSIGTGLYPPEELGSTDAREFLFFGKHWFNFSDTVKSRAQNLLSLLLNALVESEIVAKNSSQRCHEQNIPFYRFSPQLNHVIAAGETDNEKLLDMMLQTRIQTPQQGLAELASLFQLVADASKKCKYRQSRIFNEAAESA